jgi:hypothetical protein
MAEVKFAVGDEVRVHFHPPGAMRGYCEGVVSRVNVTTPLKFVAHSRPKYREEQVKASS